MRSLVLPYTGAQGSSSRQRTPASTGWGEGRAMTLNIILVRNIFLRTFITGTRIFLIFMQSQMVCFFLVALFSFS